MTERKAQNNDSKNPFCKILRNKKYYAKVPLEVSFERLHHRTHPQTQKLELHTKYTYTTILPAPVLTFALSAPHNTSFHHLHHI